MALDILQKIGLSKGEVKVYEALLDSGKSSASTIHGKTGIERRNVYDILGKLIERGLVAYITENKRRLFQAGHPTKIISYIEERQGELEKVKRDAELEIPSILEKFSLKKPAIDAEVFRGVEGMKAVWMDILNCPEIRWIGSGRYVPKRLPQFFAAWNRRRVKLGIPMFNLMRVELKKEIKVLYELEYLRFLPKEFSGNPAAIGIFGDKTASLLLGEEYFAFVIESKELAENYRKYFQYLWDHVAGKFSGK